MDFRFLLYIHVCFTGSEYEFGLLVRGNCRFLPTETGSFTLDLAFLMRLLLGGLVKHPYYKHDVFVAWLKMMTRLIFDLSDLCNFNAA